MPVVYLEVQIQRAGARSETEKKKEPIQGKAFSCLLASGTVRRFVKCISGLCDQEKGGKNQQSLPFCQELPHYSLFHTSRLHIRKSQSCYYSVIWHQRRPAVGSKRPFFGLGQR